MLTTSRQATQVRKYVSVMEMANEVDCELAGDDAQEIWVCATELFPYEDFGVSFNEMKGQRAGLRSRITTTNGTTTCSWRVRTGQP